MTRGEVFDQHCTCVQELSLADRQLVWKHRVTLTDKGPALVRLLKCANLESQRQVCQEGGHLEGSCPSQGGVTVGWGRREMR